MIVIPNSHQYAYKIIPEKELILECHAGLMNMEAAKAMKNEEVQDEYFSPDYNILADLTSAKFNLQNRMAHELFEFVSSRSDIMSEKRKVAFLTNESEQVAMSTVYKMLYKEDHNRYRVFSTLEYALIWLHIDLSEGELANELQVLKESLED